MNYTLIIQEVEEGGYVGYVPEIPGANTQGATKEEVRENIKEALKMVLEERAEEALKDISGIAGYSVDRVEL